MIHDPKDQSNDGLFARAQAGDQAAWEELFRHCYPKLVRVVRRKLTSSAMRSLYDSTDFASDVIVSVRRHNPAIPHALEAIVARCLALAPGDRYPDAQDLAEDFDRFLKHRPLAHTTNPSRRERLRDWIDRQRNAIRDLDGAIRRPTLRGEKAVPAPLRLKPPKAILFEHPLWDDELDG
jgi:hypothetical protein